MRVLQAAYTRQRERFQPIEKSNRVRCEFKSWAQGAAQMSRDVLSLRDRAPDGGYPYEVRLLDAITRRICNSSFSCIVSSEDGQPIAYWRKNQEGPDISNMEVPLLY